MSKITDLAQGRWPEILTTLANVDPAHLVDKHGPCPLCGGKDRFRFDDQDGSGSWFCNQCGGKHQNGGAGSGMDLLMRRTGWSFQAAASAIEQWCGVSRDNAGPPTKGAENVWKYSDTFYVCRFPGKAIRPLIWTGSKWQFSGPPDPRPLYNLDQIRSRNCSVLIVEGEKTADAAARLFPQVVVTTWSSGCKAIAKTDWSPLKGRRVALWPDADEPGRQAMDRLARKLISLGVERLQIVSPPPEVPQGWDLADASWTPEEARDYFKNNISQPLAIGSDEVEDEPEPEPAPPDQPFRCLGHDRGSYFYLPQEGGQVIELTASQHTELNLLNLASLDWWHANFQKGSGADWKQAADNLIKQCKKQKIYDPDRIRGRGAWYDRDRVFVHLGDRLIVDGQDYEINDPPETYYFYEHAKHLTGPATTPLSDEVAAEIRNIACRFRWEIPVNAYFLLGWTVLAPVCGALDWRPHIWITGGAGTGKTTILKSFLRPLLGGIYQAATGGTTEAGLRGTLKSDAIPVVFDEFEQNEQRDKQIMQNVLALARIASSEGGKIYKGTTGGGANSFEIRSMFCVSSINVALIQKADVDRFCVLALRRDYQTKDEWTAFERAIKETITPERGRELIARTVKNIPTIRKNARTFAKALAIRFGQRYGDQHGTLLAGAWSLSPDGGPVLTLEQANAWLQTMNWEGQQSDPSEADEMKCLNFILNALVSVEGQKMTIREIFYYARTGRQICNESPDTVLARYGIKCHEGQLAIANTHSNLQALLKDTPWSGGAHRQSLRRIDGATVSNPIRFGSNMGTLRCTLIPVTLLD